MKKLTKQEQKDEAWEDYLVITDPAWKAYKTWRTYKKITEPATEAYYAKLKEIEEQEESK